MKVSLKVCFRHRYCAADVVRNLDDVLAAHLAGPRLWRQGNNQPPFTIAAARHTLFVHPGWNVRPADAAAERAVAGRSKGKPAAADGPPPPASAARVARDECEAMIRGDVRILHSHFSPCDALPPAYCPLQRGESPDPRSPAAKALKISSVRVYEAAKRAVAKQECSCKGTHFDALADDPPRASRLEA